MTIKLSVKQELLDGCTDEEQKQINEWLKDCEEKINKEADKMFYELFVNGCYTQVVK